MSIEMIPSSREHADYIKNHVPLEDLYNQLAEEAAELSQAASKMVRILRGMNPAAVSSKEAFNSIVEEYTDVMLVASGVLDIHPDELLTDYKLYRWHKRIERSRTNIKDVLDIPEPPEELKNSRYKQATI